MTAPAAADRELRWARDNQRHLVLAAAAVAARLDARPSDAEEPERAAAALAAEVRERTGHPVGLDRMAMLFGLTRFERDLLLAAAAPELTLPAATGPVTFARALAALPDPHWSALLPDAPLRGWLLLDVPTALPPAEFGGLSQLPLAVDERALHALLGAATVDQRLAGRARLAEPVCRLTAAQLPTVTGLAALADPAAAAERRPTGGTAVVGEDRLTRRQAVLEAAALLGRSVLVVDAADVPDDAPHADALARMLAREAALGNRLVLLEATPSTVDRAGRVLAAEAGYGAPVVLSMDEPPASAELAVLRLPAASRVERERLFAAALQATGVAGDAEQLAEAYALTSAAVALGVERAGRLRAVPGVGPDVAAACGAAGSRPLRGLATVRPPHARLADLVLPDAAERALRALIAHVRQRSRVHGQWGYAERGRGLAVTALLTGPSGTGKTTAAEAVAAELGLDLVAADLSQVVSKYVGETEKNLAELFAVGESGAVLLFDEGEAVFGRRTQVKDSRDRYANLEVSYLLQRLETFTGIAIVTTNNREGMDPAFLRRMRFVVAFPFPDAAQRALLWSRVFPAAVPTEGLDPARLAQLAVSGGTIAQLALHAAFLAADADEPVRMAHVLAAARIECDKLERPLAAAEIRGWS